MQSWMNVSLKDPTNQRGGGCGGGSGRGGDCDRDQ
jgi:hypothetical protein